MSLGSDFSAVDDLDFALTFLEGEEHERLAFIQAIQRRLSTPRGALFYDPSYGLDLRNFLSDNLSPKVMQGIIAAEIRKDERVENAEVSVTPDPVVRGKYIVDMNVTAQGEDQEFALTFILSSDKFDLIKGA
jgi:phage baseplate assembly protein W